jgi:uncharacterized protein
MVIGTLDALRRYPTKSLAPEVLESANVAAGGIPGDRAHALFVLRGNERIDKPYRGKENDRLHLMAEADAARASAAERGVGVELRRGEHFFDCAPISIIVDRWIDGLNAHVGYDVEWQRFRPNFFVRADSEFHRLEGDLVGAELEVGSIRLRVRAAIVRCVVPTYDLCGGESDPRILRYIAQERDAQMGIYCDVVQPGVARAGDTLKEAPI